MTHSNSSSDYYNPFFWCFFAIFFIPALCIVFLVETIKFGSRSLRKVVRQPETLVDHEVSEEADVTTKAEETPKINLAEDSPNLWDTFQTEVSEIGRVELPRGYVVFRYYASKGVVKGKLTITETAKAQRRKKPLSVTIEGECACIRDAAEVMRVKAEKAIASMPATNKSPRQKLSCGEILRQETAAESNTELPAIPAYLMSEDAEMHSGKELEPDPFTCFAVAPEVEKSAPKRRPISKPKQLQASYRGSLLAFGKEQRKLDDPEKGERSVWHFCVRIFDEMLQAEQPLWGNDLKRVIEESDVKIGDRVELGLVGETAVLIKGKPAKKKVWSLSKL